MRSQLYKIFDRLRSSYWFIPSIMALAATALSVSAVQFDRTLGYEFSPEQRWIYTGGAEGARAVLSTIAGSVITVAGTTFSITVAALSLASAQFGPRLLRNFMRDTGNQVVLGTFTATFLYCVMVLRTVRGLDESTYVPHVSITVAIVLAVASVGVLIYFIHHVAESIQVSHIIEVAGRELDAALSTLFPERAGEPDPANGSPDLPHEPGAPVIAESHGYVLAIDQGTLLSIATRNEVTLRVTLRPGDYCLPGSSMVFAQPALPPDAEAEVRRAFALGITRTSHQDAVFAFLQLAEVALRALSPGVNDPFTAIMCIDRITAAMSILEGRALPQAARSDETGTVRLIAHPYSYHDLVEAAYRHIREAASGHWQVQRHLCRNLQALLERTKEPALRLALSRELARVPMTTPHGSES